MVISIDKLTTLRMYEKVRAEWDAEKVRVLKALAGMALGHPDFETLHARLVNLQETDMAVVVSPGQNEISEMEEKGFDILPHRERMVKEDLAEKFKNPDDPFRLVFVCAMWLTGFDVPSCSTLYLDKPMRGHTLMQTIARANRVHGDKVNGLIVDYANVFQELEKALAIYGTGTGGGEMPVKDKRELVAALRIALDQVFEFCRKQNVDLIAVHKISKYFIPAVNQLLRTDEVRDSFLGQANDIARLYKAVMPDPVIPELAPTAQLIAELAKAVRAQKEAVSITQVMAAISEVLDGAIIAEPHINPGAPAQTIDLSKIDYEVLMRKFEKTPNKNIEAQQLRALIERKLDNLIRLNASRYDFLDRFQKMIEAYNSGALSIEQLFAELVTFTKELNDEEQRHLREQISEEELAVFDILTRPGPELTPQEIESIKKVCKDLLAKLKTEKLVHAWRTKRTTRAAVRVEIEKMLDPDFRKNTPQSYSSRSAGCCSSMCWRSIRIRGRASIRRRCEPAGGKESDMWARSDPTVPPAVPVEASTPRQRGYFNQAQLDDIETAEDVHAAALANAGPLATREITAAFLTRFADTIKEARKRAADALADAAEAGVATDATTLAAKALHTALQGVQSAAKQNHLLLLLDRDPTTNFSTDGYLIGSLIQANRAVLLQSAATLILRVREDAPRVWPF